MAQMLRTARLGLLAAPLFCAASAAMAASGCEGTDLLAKTQAFSDASQRGDGAVLGGLVDDEVVFFNEGGDRADKAALAANTPAPASGQATKMTITHWACRLHGEVAVTSFIDDQVIDGRPPFHARYQSVETWLREGGAWKMIASQTTALSDDPPGVTLPAAQLDEYAGVYRAESGLTFTIARAGGHLTAALDGGPATVQTAEVRDVFFTPGRYRLRKVFQRDPQGRVTGFAYRREGHDILFSRVA